jgi:plastocyanin
VVARESAESNVQAAAPSTRKADTVVVTIRNFSFVRDKITINAGDVVVWRNADPVEHVVLADAGGFESAIEPRQDWAHRFTTPGMYTYYCKPHPFMKAEIRVREAKP